MPLLLCTLLLATAHQVTALVHANTDIVVENAHRELDLTGQVAVLREELTLKHSGQKAAAGILICSSSRLAERLAFFELRQIRPNTRKLPEKPVLQAHSVIVQDSPFGASCRAAVLDTVMKSGDVVVVEAYGIFTKVMEPFPEEISRGEAQRMLFEDELLMVTPYVVSRQSLSVKLPGRAVEPYTLEPPVQQADNTLEYGPFPKKMPWSFKPLSINFEHAIPFVEVPELERTIMISQWGNIQVEDSYLLKNGGAKLERQQSSLNRTTGNFSLIPQIEEMLMHLPSEAHSFYSYDERGSIPPSNMIFRNSDKGEVIIRLRLPVAGGSSMRITVGYNLPTEACLWHTSNGYLRLTMRLGCPVEKAVVDSLAVKVVLPEGAKDIKVRVPFPASTSEEKRYTYLDPVGRPVKVFRMGNVIWKHNQDFSLHYTFNTALMVQEPMLITTMMLLLFGAAIASSRMDWSGGKERSASSSATLLSSCLQQVKELLCERGSMFKQLDSLANNQSTERDLGGAEAERDAIEAALASSLAKLKGLQDEVKQLNGEEGARVEEVCKLEEMAGDRYIAFLSAKTELVEKNPRKKRADKQLKKKQEDLESIIEQAQEKRQSFLSHGEEASK